MIFSVRKRKGGKRKVLTRSAILFLFLFAHCHARHMLCYSPHYFPPQICMEEGLENNIIILHLFPPFLSLENFRKVLQSIYTLLTPTSKSTKYPTKYLKNARNARGGCCLRTGGKSTPLFNHFPLQWTSGMMVAGGIKLFKL